MNSPTKPLSPGRPMLENVNSMKNTASQGAFEAMPPRLAIVPRVESLVDHAHQANSPAEDRPWLTSCRFAPSTATGVSANRPITM
jgi:hypothetical protein